MCNEHHLMISFVQTCKGKRNFIVQVTVVPLNHFQAVTWQSTPVLNPKLHLHCNKKRIAPVYPTDVTLVYIPKEQRRVTGVCVQYKLLSARQVWVRLSHKQQAKFKLHLKNRWDLNT